MGSLLQSGSLLMSIAQAWSMRLYQARPNSCCRQKNYVDSQHSAVEWGRFIIQPYTEIPYLWALGILGFRRPYAQKDQHFNKPLSLGATSDSTVMLYRTSGLSVTLHVVANSRKVASSPT